VDLSFRTAIREQWGWAKGYNPGILTDDLLAAVVVTVLLVPQCLAYALLAGLPPQIGIYASIFPLLAYAALGSSNFLNVGPTAVISLMTAVCIASLPPEMRLVSAAALALVTGVILTIAGFLKAGFVMNFVSRPVVSAYITGAALLIIISQIKHILGIPVEKGTAFGMIQTLVTGLDQTNSFAIATGVLAAVGFYFVRTALPYLLVKSGVRARTAKIIARMAPILIIAAFVVVSAFFGLNAQFGLAIVGEVPSGLPPFQVPELSRSGYEELLVPAIVIAIVAFVDSTSTAQELASRRRDRVDANKELLGLGAANAVAGLTGGYPINGSMSRSAVNFTAGGKTPLSGVMVAGFMALTALFLTPVLEALPLSVLAALIIVACLNLLDFGAIWRSWVYSRTDGLTAVATFLAVLILGVQWGVMAGVILAMALHIRHSLQPNMPLVGRFPGTEHYRDAAKFNVETDTQVKTIRIDEGLYYANARILEDRVAEVVREHEDVSDIILMCTGVNHIDASALSSLTEINRRLKGLGINLHFSDMQSVVRERLYRSDFLEALSGQVFLSQHDAMLELQPEPDWAQYSDHIDIH
jgi:SulP family sulfate permease